MINDRALRYLPFYAEPLLQWNIETDLLGFLYEICDQPGVIVMSDGTREDINYRFYGRYLYEEGKEESRYWAHRCTRSTKENAPAPGASRREIHVPDFYENPTFGEVAKYMIAWEGTVHATLSSGLFFSIAHILESLNDLACSRNLALQLYYKQASQILRNFLEDLVLPVHFAQKP